MASVSGPEDLPGFVSGTPPQPKEEKGFFPGGPTVQPIAPQEGSAAARADQIRKELSIFVDRTKTSTTREPTAKEEWETHFKTLQEKIQKELQDPIEQESPSKEASTFVFSFFYFCVEKDADKAYDILEKLGPKELEYLKKLPDSIPTFPGRPVSDVGASKNFERAIKIIKDGQLRERPTVAAAKEPPHISASDMIKATSLKPSRPMIHEKTGTDSANFKALQSEVQKVLQNPGSSNRVFSLFCTLIKENASNVTLILENLNQTELKILNDNLINPDKYPMPYYATMSLGIWTSERDNYKAAVKQIQDKVAG